MHILDRSVDLIRLKSREVVQYKQFLLSKKVILRQKFLLVCDYRSGSTLLANLLNQHPDIYCDGEIFIPFVKSKLARVVWPYGYLQGRLANTSKSIYGFDCKVSQIMAMGINPQNTATRFFENLHRKNWKFIYLKRLNIVRQSLSNYIANARNQWHDQPQDPLNRKKVTVNLRRLNEGIENRRRLNIISQSLMENIPHMPLVYEHDLLPSDCHEKTVKKVCDYLNVKGFYRETSMKRVSADKLSDDINNLDEVINFLMSSPYAEYIDFEC